MKVKKGVIIISKDGLVFNSKELFYHIDYLKLFCEELGILYTKNGTSYEVDMDLADSNYITILIEDELLIVFIPEQVNLKQYDYFMKNKEYFNKHELLGGYMKNGMISYIEEKEDSQKDSFYNKIYTKIKK